jgi:formylglycine-generating enzyme required for sulfatase activity
MILRLYLLILIVALLGTPQSVNAQASSSSADPLRRGHALLIGISHYADSDWPQLDDIPLQLEALQAGLKDHFETIEVRQDLDARQLWQTIDRFIRSHGNDSDARLFVYYAGHGYTEVISQYNENRGYITGTDTPSTRRGTLQAYNESRLRAVSMLQISSLLREVLARHVLFVFDSCFAGTIFTTRSESEPPRILSSETVARLMEQPARAFITAGRASERVPSHSPIPELLLAALGGAADPYNQGVTSATAIGMYLKYAISQMTGVALTPQEGKLPDPAFAQGDFLFRISRSTAQDGRRGDPALFVRPGSSQSFRDSTADGLPCAICPEMVVVPSGKFAMGSGTSADSSNDGPQHNVTVARPFAVAKFSVTRGEFQAFINETKYAPKDGCKVLGKLWELERDRSWRSPGFVQDSRHPVVCIDWNDAKAFVSWLSKKTAKPYRLLTEAEWEYAARTGTTTQYHFGDNDSDYCRYGNGPDQSLKTKFPNLPVLPCDDGHVYTAPVGSFPPNAFGLYDMYGNTMQWVEDCANFGYKGAPSNGSPWTSGDCKQHMERGGSWSFLLMFLTASARMGIPADSRFDTLGFRVARSLTP